ncbi:tyrosine-protein kinase RYK isoform X1 [Hyperolius riggenbachi]|uniref:tyrosine-protein kinase RYK isoform X1 n=1 Tax=Hyperolius riggenbachi TaxID=752182 RepID=UPI0035A3A81D
MKSWKELPTRKNPFRKRNSLKQERDFFVKTGKQTDLITKIKDVHGPSTRIKGNQGRVSKPLSHKANNDELKVGGRLGYFLPHWKTITKSPFILNLIKRGYHIAFQTKPPRKFVVTKPLSLPQHQTALKEIIADMLDRHVVSVVPVTQRGEGFYSKIFLVQKPSGKYRIILNLKPINPYIKYEKFRMESIYSLKNLLIPHGFMASIDLQDAYWHIPIELESQKFLRFAVEMEGRIQHLQFRCLPFGITSAPRIFTKVMGELIGDIHRQGIIVIPYLDDLLIVARTLVDLEEHRQTVLKQLQQAGWIVSKDKSQLTPTQNILFLGFIIDSVQQRILLPQEKVQKIMSEVEKFNTFQTIKIRQIMQLLGLLSSVAPAIQWALMHTRVLQSWMLSKWNKQQDTLDNTVTVEPHIKDSLRWWQTSQHLTQGRLWSIPIQKILTTDASQTGWGAHVNKVQVQGLWNHSMAEQSSNFRELMAVKMAIMSTMHLLESCHVQVQSDNSTVVSYLNRQGGTRSKRLLFLTLEILEIAEHNFLSLTAVHLKGELNVLADQLSRVQTTNTEWSLNQKLFELIVSKWGQPHIDLFANRSNRKCKQFYSLNVMDKPMAIDALAQNWDQSILYAFPPLNLIPIVLQKLLRSQCQMILIAPNWPRRSWYPLLLSMLATQPWEIPVSEDMILVQGQAVVNLERWKLTAWFLKGQSLRVKDCQPE